jgi:hypothetical protein
LHDQPGHRHAHGFQAIAWQAGFGQNFVDQLHRVRDRELGIANHGGYLAHRSQLAASVRHTDVGGTDTEADAEVRRGRVVELEQPRAAPPDTDRVVVTHLVHDPGRDQILDDR